MAEKEVKVVITGNSTGAEKVLNATSALIKKVKNEVNDLAEAHPKAANKIRAAQDSIAGAARNTASVFKSTGSITVGAVKGFIPACRNATASINKMNAAIGMAASVAAATALGGVVSSIVGMGASAIQAAGQMKQYEIAFTTMLKSAKEGKALLEDLKDFAAKTPFDIPGVVETAQQLLAFGFNANEIIPTLRTLGDAAAGLGKGSEGVRLMAYALGQMRTSGTLKTQDVNQLTNAGIAVWEMLAEASGKTINEIKEMTENGMIDSGKAVDVIVSGMTDKFSGMMEKTSQEVIGLSNNIKEGMWTASATIGDYLTESLGVKDILKVISDRVDVMVRSLKEARAAGKSLGEAIGEAVPAPVLAAMGALAAIVGVTFVGAAVAAGSALLAFIGLSAPVVAGIGAIGAAAVLLATHWNEVWETIVDTVRFAIMAVFAVITGVADAIIMTILGLGKGILTIIGNALEAITGYFPDWVESWRAALDSALQWVIEFSQKAISCLKEVLSVKDKVTEATSDSGGGEEPQEEKKSIFDEYADKAKEKIKDLLPEGMLPKGGLGGGGGGGLGGGSLGGGIAGASAFDQKEAEINRLNEALARAIEQTTSLQKSFQKLNDDVNFRGLEGSEKVFAQIRQERDARIEAVNESLSKQKQAVDEALAYKTSAEATGDKETIEKAAQLYDQRNALYQESLLKAKDMRAQIEAQANEESLSLTKQLEAAKADIDVAMNEATREGFLELLDEEKVAKLAALQEEQEARQQLLDWRLESQQSMLDFEMQAAETLKNQLASGFAELVTSGGSFSDKIKEITKNMINMFIQYMIKRKAAALLNQFFGNQEATAQVGQNTAIAKSLVPAAVQKSIAELGPIAGPGAYAAATTAMTAMGMGTIIPAFKNGGRASGLSLVGENGPELVDFDHPGRVYTAKQTAAMLNPSMMAMASYTPTAYANSGGSDSGATVVATLNNYGDINNAADLDDLMDGLNGAIAAGLRGA